MIDLNDADFIARLNAHLAAGGVIAFPTDTVWGLGALPNARGADALYAIKRRPREKHLIIMSDSMTHIAPHMRNYPPVALDLARRFWPGALTLAVPVADADTMLFGGVRIPNSPDFHALCRVVHGHCLATTSANISGMQPLKNVAEIRQTFPNVIVVDNGATTSAGAPSTIALCENDKITILRQGAVII